MRLYRDARDVIENLTCALACACHALGMRLACAWHALGMRLACAWHALGMRLACAWHALGMRLACAWHARYASVAHANFRPRRNLRRSERGHGPASHFPPERQ